MQLKPNTLLKGGEFRIIEMLGHGGFGITYLAEQLSLNNRKVCIKEFFPTDYYRRDGESQRAVAISEKFAADMEPYKAKFYKEANTIAAFRHHNIITIYDVFTENDTVYYVMDYIDGCSLRDMIANGGPIRKGRALKYIRETAHALAHIHSKDSVHLDIKPANIMVRDEDDSVTVIDFGLSKHYNEDGTPTSTTPGGFSRGYTPLEMYQTQVERKFLPQTDIYSLGATLYTLLTGKVPPEASDVSIYGVPQHSNIDAQLYSVIDAAMTPNPTKRPQSIKEFLALLDSAVGGGNGDNGGNNDNDGSQDNGSNGGDGGNNDNGGVTIIKTAATSKIEDIVNNHFDEAGRAGIIIKTNKSDIIYTDIFIDGVKSFRIRSKAKGIGAYRVYANSALVTDALTKLSNKFSKIILPGNEHVLGNQPQVIQSIINDVVTTIDPAMEASRISSKCYITKRNSFSQILLKLFMYLILPAGVSFGIGFWIADLVSSNWVNIYDEYNTYYDYVGYNDNWEIYEYTLMICGILFTPIFSIIFNLIFNIKTKIGLGETILKIATIISLTLCTILVIDTINIPDEITKDNFNFGSHVHFGEHECYSQEDIEKHIENKLNNNNTPIGFIILVYTIIWCIYYYIHSIIAHKKYKNTGGLWLNVTINTLTLIFIITIIITGCFGEVRTIEKNWMCYVHSGEHHWNWKFAFNNSIYINTYFHNDIFNPLKSLFLSIPICLQTIFFAYANKPRKLLKGGSIK